MHPAALSQLAFYAPFAAVNVIGLIALYLHWKKMGSAGVLVLVALLTHLLATAARLYTEHWFYTAMDAGTSTMTELARVRGWVAVPMMLLNVGAWAVLILAAFAGRTRDRA